MVATFGRFRGLRFHVRPTQMLESTLFARVAELVDALASGASGRKVVGVQVPPRAQRTKSPSPRPAEGRVRGFFVLAGRNLALAGSAPRGLSRPGGLVQAAARSWLRRRFGGSAAGWRRARYPRCRLKGSCRLHGRGEREFGGRATQWPGSGAFVDAGAAADSGEAEGPGAHARGRVVLTAGQFGRMELAVVSHRQRHPGVRSVGHGLPTRTAIISEHDEAGEEFDDAARTVAEEPDALASEILIVVEQGAQTAVERSRVRIAEATVVQGARGQPSIPRALGT